MQDSRKTIRRNLKVLLSMLEKGQFLEAQEMFLHNDVILREGNDEPKKGKDFCMAAEKEVLQGVSEFIGYTVVQSAVAKGVSFYEVVMEYVQKDGARVRVEQAVVTKWENNQIIEERYYHA